MHPRVNDSNEVDLRYSLWQRYHLLPPQSSPQLYPLLLRAAPESDATDASSVALVVERTDRSPTHGKIKKMNRQEHYSRRKGEQAR